MLIGWGVSERQDPQKCHFLYLLERPLQQSCTTVQTVIVDLFIFIVDTDTVTSDDELDHAPFNMELLSPQPTTSSVLQTGSMISICIVR